MAPILCRAPRAVASYLQPYVILVWVLVAPALGEHFPMSPDDLNSLVSLVSFPCCVCCMLCSLRGTTPEHITQPVRNDGGALGQVAGSA